MGQWTFGAPSHFSVGDGPVNLILQDFDNDGLPDLGDGQLLVRIRFGFENLGGALFSPAVHFNVQFGVRWICALDFEGDLDLDIVSANEESDSYSLLYNLNICSPIAGDSNYDRTFNGNDVTYSLNYLKNIGPDPSYCHCPPSGLVKASADANGDCNFNGLDVSYCVNYLKALVRRLLSVQTACTINCFAMTECQGAGPRPAPF